MSSRRTGPADQPTDRGVITTRDGFDLRCERRTAAAPVAAAVLCHPHPLHGGTMYAPVVQRLFDTLPDVGVTVLRFNFRGVQGSEGAYDDGRGERLDIAAAIAALHDDHPELPIWLAGWSFGADVGLATDGPAVAGWIAIAPPLGIGDPSVFVAGVDDRPTTLICPQHDQFRPPEAAADVTRGWSATTVETVPMADHFFGVGLDRVAELTATAIIGTQSAGTQSAGSTNEDAS